MERRVFQTELRALTDSAGNPIIEGYGAVFNSLSLNLGGFKERVQERAFTKTLQEGDPRSLFGHSPLHVLGRRSAGTLEVWTDSKGLGYRVKPPNAQWARDLMASIERGDIRESSFMFDTIRDSWLDKTQEGDPIRDLVEVRLYELGPVTFPAYEDTEVEIRTRRLIRAGYYRSLEKRGRNLAAWLNEKIDKVAESEETDRGEIIARIAESTERDEDTIRNILSANIDCPPVEVLEGFGRILNAPTGELISIAETDGCSYEEERSAPVEDNHPDCNGDTRDIVPVRLSQMYKELQILESEVYT